VALVKIDVFTANVVACSLILFTLLMVAIFSFETLGIIGATRRHSPEDDILEIYYRVKCIAENLSMNLHLLLYSVMCVCKGDAVRLICMINPSALFRLGSRYICKLITFKVAEKWHFNMTVHVLRTCSEHTRGGV
jgi:hypothetical protein